MSAAISVNNSPYAPGLPFGLSQSPGIEVVKKGGMRNSSIIPPKKLETKNSLDYPDAPLNLFNIFDRTLFNMRKEFTATVYLIDNEKILLIYHAKLEKWLPPGGHLEENETPAEAARREVFEETGLKIEFESQENISIDCWNAKSIERPYMCLLENIPIYRETPAHQHIDFIYVARPTQIPEKTLFSCEWFSWNDLQQLKPDVEIFQETLDVIKHLLQKFKAP